jgi:hypothetical protein
MVELMKKLNLTYEEPTIFIMEDKNKEHLMSLEYESRLGKVLSLTSLHVHAAMEASRHLEEIPRA